LPAAPLERNTGSLQKLLLVAAGALALAGLTGSAVYRLGRRRRNAWLRERTASKLAQNSSHAPWVDPRFAPAHSIPDLEEARLAALDPGFSLGTSKEDDHIDERVEKIEDYLMRLTRQLQDEVQGSTATRTDRNMRAEP
jgi:hypothetical protein